ncbi:hypothetical protein IW262DRAFT_247562 [Armillaria fumosa]|nr:hypothetical protein IW262DRAFT_247562 [Armillaria fumosa]
MRFSPFINRHSLSEQRCIFLTQFQLVISYLGVAPLETFSLVSGASAVGLNLPEIAHEMRITSFHSASAVFVLCIHIVTRDIASTFCRAGRSVFTAMHRSIALIHRLWLHAAEVGPTPITEYGVLTRKNICHTECARTEERRRSRRCGNGKLKPGSAEMQQEVYSVSPTLIHVLSA